MGYPLERVLHILCIERETLMRLSARKSSPHTVHVVFYPEVLLTLIKFLKTGKIFVT